jgi:diguanylate cyclase
MHTILVMDDNTEYRRTLLERLRLENYRTLEALNGLGGIERIHQHSPDLIISDLEMPSMKGCQVLKRVKAHPTLAKTPFIMLTGYSNESFLRSLLDFCLDAYFLKPVGLTELLLAIEKCLTAGGS